MATVAQLIVKLLTLPQDADVECLKEVSVGYHTWTEMTPVDLDDLGPHEYDADSCEDPTLYKKKFVSINAI